MLKILIWGTGSGAVKYLKLRFEMLRYINIIAFVNGQKTDNKTEYFQLPDNTKKNIIPPKEILKYDFDYIAVISSYFKEIKEEAIKIGIEEKKIITSEELYELWSMEGYEAFEKKYQKWIVHKEYSITNKRSDYVWVLWLQGYENAPILVQKCIDSIKKYTKGKNFRLVTLNNLSDYINVPSYIMEKFKDGKMGSAHFSDIIRVLLLEKYGGIWMDATIYLCDKLPEKIENNDFFVFRTGISDTNSLASSWFINTCKNHIFLKEMKNLLIQYWQENEKQEHYYIFHYFFKMVTNCYKEEWNKIPYIDNSKCYLLFSCINDRYSNEYMNYIRKKSPIQKLNRRQEIKENNYHSFFGHLFL